jgi:RNA recognition motif-containing protein
MAAREDNRIFVGGLAWETTEKHLEAAFSVYGKVLQALVCFPIYKILKFFVRNYDLLMEHGVV